MKKAVRKKTGQAVNTERRYREPEREKSPEVEALEESLRRAVHGQESVEQEPDEEEEKRVLPAEEMREAAEEETDEDALEEEEEDTEEEAEEEEEDTEEEDEEDEEEEEPYYSAFRRRPDRSNLVGALVRKLVFCVSLGVFTYAVVGLGVLAYGYWIGEQEYSDIVDNAVIVGTTSAPEQTDGASGPSGGQEPNIDISAPSQEENTAPMLPIEVNVEWLKAVNQDYVMWITIPGTNINYPVVQGYDRDHYLRYTFQNKENMAGAIFLDYRTDRNMWLETFNTIIIGHNRKDGKMFSELLKYRDAEFWKENPYIYLVKDGVEYVYEIFSFYELGTTSIAYNPYTDPDAYLEHLKTHNDYTTDIMPTLDDHIITLYTCTDDSSGRYLCHAILRKTYEL